MAETIRSVLQKTVEYFKRNGIGETSRLDAEVLLAHVLDMERIYLYVEFDRPLTVHELDEYREAVRKRAARMPVAYITGVKEFMSNEYKVTPAVLIPRPETEILFQSACEYFEGLNTLPSKCVDIGTGSGVLAIELAKRYEGTHVFAVDLSQAALEVAEINARIHNVLDRVDFLCGDLFEPLEGVVEKESLDLIISNPPYISSTDIASLQPEVSRYEPHIALDGGPSGFDFYTRIVKDGYGFLKSNGVIALEVGCGQAGFVVKLLEHHGYRSISVVSDYAGIDRVVIGCK